MIHIIRFDTNRTSSFCIIALVLKGLLPWRLADDKPDFSPIEVVFTPLISHIPYHTRTGYNSFHTVWTDGEAMRYTRRLRSLRGKPGVRFSCLWDSGLPGLVCPFQPLCIAVLLRGWEDCLSKHTTTWRRGRDWRRHLRQMSTISQVIL